MAQSTLIPPATAAQNTPQPFGSTGYSYVVVGADNLPTYAATKSATAGACGVYVLGGSARVLNA